MQTLTNATCPTTRTRANDARDNRSYYIQKLADGRCWMLTNLAYGGGGTNTYKDVRSLTQATSGISYTVANYYVHASANPTSGTVNPSTSGNQYGYLYNYCAAMGGQSNACTASDIMPTPNQDISACPAGWRLPTSGSYDSGQGDFSDLDRAFGGTGKTITSGADIAWWGPSGQFMGTLAGSWRNGLGGAGVNGALFTSSAHKNWSDMAYFFSFSQSGIYFAEADDRFVGYSVRCLI